MPEGATFITVGNARKQINVRARSTMQNLLPILPCVYIEARQTRLMPAGYIRGLAEHLDGRSATLPLVREFNRTPDASRLCNEAMAWLEEAVGSREEHSPEEVAMMLGVGRMTISDWVKDGVVAVERKPRKGRKALPAHPMAQRQVIKPEDLSAILQWVNLP